MIYKTVYTIAWYELPVSFKTEICLLMLRSQKSSKITAGKFYVMHLENFNAVRNYHFLYHKMYKKYSCNIHIIKNILILIFLGVEHGCLILHVAPKFWLG